MNCTRVFFTPVTRSRNGDLALQPQSCALPASSQFRPYTAFTMVAPVAGFHTCTSCAPCAGFTRVTHLASSFFHVRTTRIAPPSQVAHSVPCAGYFSGRAPNADLLSHELRASRRLRHKLCTYDNLIPHLRAALLAPATSQIARLALTYFHTRTGHLLPTCLHTCALRASRWPRLGSRALR
ncbi:hypothetical protein B0H19DRAFT_1257614 [Mycena capillaripes]|nr:hypothetical protein B0H19DRAFT_1257614 [Mycena capillaripes]